MLRASLDKLYDVCGYIAAAFMAGIAVAILAQMIARMRGITLDSTEAAGFCLAASTFFGLAHTFRRGAHVRITLLAGRLSPGAKRRVEILNCLLGAAVIGFLGWHVSQLALQSYQFNDISPGLLAMPFWIPQLGVAVGIIVLAIALIDELLWLLAGGAPRYDGHSEVDLDKPVA